MGSGVLEERYQRSVIRDQKEAAAWARAVFLLAKREDLTTEITEESRVSGEAEARMEKARNLHGDQGGEGQRAQIKAKKAAYPSRGSGQEAAPHREDGRGRFPLWNSEVLTLGLRIAGVKRRVGVWPGACLPRFSEGNCGSTKCLLWRRSVSGSLGRAEYLPV